jgi:hypothetical protein
MRDITLTPKTQRDLQLMIETDLDTTSPEQQRIFADNAKRIIELTATAPTNSKEVEIINLREQINSLRIEQFRTQLELNLSRTRNEDLEAREVVCTPSDLQQEVLERNARSTREQPKEMEELRQDLEDAQEQLKSVGEERKMCLM